MNLLTYYLFVETRGCPHPTPMPTCAGIFTLCFTFSMTYCLQQEPVSFFSTVVLFQEILMWEISSSGNEIKAVMMFAAV